MLSPDLVILKGGRPDLVMKCSPDQYVGQDYNRMCTLCLTWNMGVSRDKSKSCFMNI